MLGWVDDRELSRVLPKTEAKALARDLGIRTCGQLLDYYPRTYSHHGGGVAAGPVEHGDLITFVGEVVYKKYRPASTKRSVTQVRVRAADTIYNATFFNTSLPNVQLKTGMRVIMTGKLQFFHGRPNVQHPTYFVIPEPGERKQRAIGGLDRLAAYGDAKDIAELLFALEWVPIYPEKKFVNSWRIIGAINEVLRNTDIPEPLDYVPHGLVSMGEALRGIHQPDEQGPDRFITRLKYNEALSLALVMALRRADASVRTAPECRPRSGGYQQELFDVLPYDLTAGQAQVLTEIAGDLSNTVPMTRLLQGEVGSGKTVVALAAMLQVVDAGRQCALLAPTEVLAAQHARTLRNLLLDLPVNVVLLTGGLSVAEKRQALLDIVSGDADIVVGTHALIQDAVEFFDLGLVVVDEQHRFGVEQRDILRNRGREGVTPHLLVMTATPIPRTIAMTVFGDLAISTLRELPRGRQPIISAVVNQERSSWVARAWGRITEELDKGHQVYIVCPRIEGDGGVLNTFEQLDNSKYSKYNLAYLHGRLHPDEKEQVMRDFACGDIDILVSTTVIEVGVDVPNATVMLIREAENFGVAQLHQLRGRVGRGDAVSYCLFHTGHPMDSPSYRRLEAVAAVNDGFEIAEIDLRYRQEGDVLGTAQSGVVRRMKLLSLINDYDIIRQATIDARDLVARNRPLAEQLISDVDMGVQEFLEKS